MVIAENKRLDIPFFSLTFFQPLDSGHVSSTANVDTALNNAINTTNTIHGKLYTANL